MTQTASDNRHVVVPILESQVIIDITLETDAKVSVGKYHSPAFDDGPVEVVLINNPRT